MPTNKLFLGGWFSSRHPFGPPPPRSPIVPVIPASDTSENPYDQLQNVEAAKLFSLLRVSILFLVFIIFLLSYGGWNHKLPYGEMYLNSLESRIMSRFCWSQDLLLSLVAVKSNPNKCKNYLFEVGTGVTKFLFCLLFLCHTGVSLLNENL